MRSLLLLLFLGPFLLTAQPREQWLAACVQGADGKAVIGANVSIAGNYLKGTATDEYGCFQLRTKQFPLTLVISHLNFKTQSLSINGPADLPAQLVLERGDQALPNVTVRARGKIDTVYHEPYSVTDYVFYEGHLILLACKNSIVGFSLILLNEAGEEVQDFSLRAVRPKSLYESCAGQLYLITGANVIEILIEQGQLVFGERLSRNDFSDGLANCVLANDSLAFFKRYFYQGQALQYTALTRYTEEPEATKLPLIEDDRNIVLLIEETGNRMPWSGDVWEDNITDGLKNLRDSRYALAGIMKIFYPPLNAPLYSKDSMLCIFNHFAGQLQYFDPRGVPVDTLSINYHLHKKWKKKIYYDPFREQAYTTFDTPTGVIVRPIDMQTGALGRAIEIPMDFIEQVKIWNGYLYYLYRNRGMGEWNRKLHRLYLSP